MTLLIDLDGTLIDSRPGIAASLEAALRALGHTPDPAFDITPMIGPPLPSVIGRVLALYNDDRVDIGIDAYRAHYGDVGLHQFTLYPGIAETLPALAEHQRCFVVTSKRSLYAKRIIEKLGYTTMLGGVYGTEADGSLDDKADLIAAVLHKEDLDPSETIMVGDRLHDIHGAHANGLRAVGVLWGYGSRAELEQAGADTLVSGPAELLGLVA
ncbi:MAG TPA: HAD hydrolase-like protein [Acetobacteraceae bacterium]|nr:HAD hydrolase-like protein [Acetobacteraceae bacterium]